MKNSHYRLKCLGCGKMFADSEESFLLGCDVDHPPAFLRSVYSRKKLVVREKESGIFRYREWLPVRRSFSSARQPIVYQSYGLAGRLGLVNLFIVFSGYWPERDAMMETCSFKELEAFSTTGRLSDSEKRTMVVSSAGNTGMSFLQICSEYGVPLLVVLTEDALNRVWMTREKHPDVKLAVLQGDSDYFEAIEFAQAIARLPGYFGEGGARNVARRDGMGTVVLTAAEALGVVPDHYVQAIGSGTGGIAAWEMSLRLNADGRYGSRKMRMHFAQNEPFCIMTDAWQRRSRKLPELDEETAKSRIRQVRAHVLTNRKPPYSIQGGVFDALTDTDGCMYRVANEEARRAGELFEELEGCDLHPAAEVALAGLIQGVNQGSIGKTDRVLLNLTGGGMKKLEQENRKIPLEPDILFQKDDATEETITRKLEGMSAGIPIYSRETH